MVEGQAGLTWPRWQRIAVATEGLGFAGLYRSDHFVGVTSSEDSLELVTSLTWLASNTNRIRFGPLVAPVSFRDPIMLARQALALADLSAGRYVHGIGAGWQEREHRMFGYDLADIPTRFARLEEALELTARFLRSPDPVTFEGRFWRVREAVLAPRPEAPPALCVGGGGPRRTLSLVARYADVWNGTFLDAGTFRARCEALDELLAKEGRKPADVRRTMMTGLFFGRDEAALAARVERLRDRPGFAGKDLDGVVAELRARGVVAGTAATIGDQMRELAAAGCEEIMLQWLTLDDLEGLRDLAAAVVPSV